MSNEHEPDPPRQVMLAPMRLADVLERMRVDGESDPKMRALYETMRDAGEAAVDTALIPV